MRTSPLAVIIIASTLLTATHCFAQLPFVNWENHPVHPIDLSPNERLLAVTHTTDNRVQLFDVSTEQIIKLGHIVVGIDPVSVRFRNDNELWVINHVSDSVSIIDLDTRSVQATLQTSDEPFDVVFAGTPERAYVSCSQANVVEAFDPENLDAAPRRIEIGAEDPRALAVSKDGERVYVAIFESGNASTILGGATAVGDFPPNVTRGIDTPYDGQNPPPNDGSNFTPPLTADLGEPPKVGLIVKKDAAGRWLDDNGTDWTRWVSGDSASDSGRVMGWDLADRDVAVIDTSDLSVEYVSGLMNVGMAIGVNPSSGAILMVGTDATNEIRFEPNLRGVFLRVNAATVQATLNEQSVRDLNPHLSYATGETSADNRKRSVADPRGVVWSADGQTGYVAGMGSNNVVTVTENGQRNSAAPIEVGEGPIGLAIQASSDRLFVWNHFEASVSVINLIQGQEVERLTVFNPLPEVVRKGRSHFYDAHATSGLGHASCASCHVDGRWDRLAWDLGDPSGQTKEVNQNCVNNILGAPCAQTFHPMKGPMVTQTLQDIMGKEPFHWRGDRDGLHEFRDAFDDLMGSDRLSSEAIEELGDFLTTIAFGPNPYRGSDNSLSTSVDLRPLGLKTTADFGSAGRPINTGNARTGEVLFRTGRRFNVPGQDLRDNCVSCHIAPTGMAVDGPHFAFDGTRIGGRELPPGPNGEAHLGIVAQSTLTSATMKVPQLRNMHEKIGFSLSDNSGRAGFGFIHDGSVDTLTNFLALDDFDARSDQDIADFAAFMVSFSGSDLPGTNQAGVTPPASLDTHAAVGAQVTIQGSTTTSKLDDLISTASSPRVDLVAHARSSGELAAWHYRSSTNDFIAAINGATDSLAAVLQTRGAVTFTLVPGGLGARLALDRDGDGMNDTEEIAQGSNPADALSQSLTPYSGNWYNPARSGHGIDLQKAGSRLIATWYTYKQDATPIWYQAVGPLDGDRWSADLKQFSWNSLTQSATGDVVGSVALTFENRRRATFDWTLNGESGSEPLERLEFDERITVRNYQGVWYDPNDSGWGVSIDTQADTRVSIAFFYDAMDEPRWVFGVSQNEANQSVDMKSYLGFCPSCDYVETTSTSGGEISVRFSTPRTGRVDMDVFYPDLPGSDWRRTNAELVPLSEPYIDPRAE